MKIKQLFAVMMCALLSSVCHGGRVLTTPDFSQLFFDFDSAGFSKVIPLADGGMIVVGRFGAYVEGKLFRHVMRFKPDGLPDTSWRVDVPGESVCDATVTPAGVMLCVTVRVHETLTKANLHFVSHDGKVIRSGPIAEDYSMRSIVLGRHYTPQAHIFALLDGQVSRIDATTGALLSSVPYRPDQLGWFASQPQLPQFDAGGGVWLTGCGLLYSYHCGARRYSVPSGYVTGTDTVLFPQYTVYDLPRNVEPKVAINSTHAYAGGYRIDRNGTLTPAYDGRVEHADDEHMYYRPSKFPTYVMRAQQRNGYLYQDPDWLWFLPPGLERYRQMGQWISLPGNEAAQLLGTYDHSIVPMPMVIAVARESIAQESAPTVVEYYLPALKHYFITGRKNEQQMLDALPASFQRTGMTFTAASSRYRDVPEEPVCRMYFPPANGGSNTHFYGVGEDCRELHRIGGLQYEGFDFSVQRPVAGACTGSATQPVRRMYNNKAAANDSNHRYVVGEATRARMVGLGWVDEGVVFCAVGVTDAVG